MSCYHGSKISWSQQPFFTATAICIVKRWKWSMGYCFAPECNHTQESHTCQFFFFFFLPDLQDHSLLRSRHFATMVTQHDNFSPLLQSLQTLQESCIYIHLLKLSASDHKYTCIHGWNGRQQYIYIYLLNIWQFIKMCSENPLLRPGHDNTWTMYCKYLNLTKRGCQVFSFCSFQIKKWPIFWENTTGLLPPGHSGCIKGVAIHKGGFSNCTCSQIPCLRCKRTVI